MQSVLSVLYPPQCIACGEVTSETAALCPTCWRDTAFITGATCKDCGTPLLGDAPGDRDAICDECINHPRLWDAGISVLEYKGIARKLILALKHGDRQDLVKPFAGWIAGRLPPSDIQGSLILPVPIHWRRLVSRRYNQSALLARAVAKLAGATLMPDGLVRVRNTKIQEGLSFEERHAQQTDAIRVNPRRLTELQGQNILLIDDVMTSGATLIACATALSVAKPAGIQIVTLARVVKDYA